MTSAQNLSVLMILSSDIDSSTEFLFLYGGVWVGDVQIVGEPSVVRKALLQVASRLHENPSRSQHLLLSSSANIYQSAGLFLSAPLIGSYGNHSTRRDEASAREFSLRLVCPTGNIGGVIGKGGGIIKQIRQESGASIKVDSSGAEGDDCIIFISAKEVRTHFFLLLTIYEQLMFLICNTVLLVILRAFTVL